MKQVWKKRAVVVAVLLFTGAAVYLNWRYTDNVADTSKVLGQSTLVSAQEDSAGADSTSVADDYFATARLSRKQARDNAISMLKELSNSNKLIGIISHRAELREEIGKKIVIQKSNKGSNIEIDLGI